MRDYTLAHKKTLFIKMLILYDGRLVTYRLDKHMIDLFCQKTMYEYHQLKVQFQKDSILSEFLLHQNYSTVQSSACSKYFIYMFLNEEEM